MTMQTYLTEIETAVTGVLSLVWPQEEKWTNLMSQLERLELETQKGYAAASALVADAETPEEVVEFNARGIDTYFGPDKQRHETAAEILRIEARVQVQAFSTNSLAGALLQHAKQGISLVHGPLSACPPGAPSKPWN